MTEQRDDQDREPADTPDLQWMTRVVGGIGTASFLADVGHEVPTALMASLVTGTLGARADRGQLRRTGRRRPVRRRPLADDVERRCLAVGGCTATAVQFSLIGTAGNVVTVGLLRGGAWAARGLRVPARNALLADVVPASACGRAYGFERTMDNLGAILISVIPGLLAALTMRRGPS